MYFHISAAISSHIIKLVRIHALISAKYGKIACNIVKHVADWAFYLHENSS